MTTLEEVCKRLDSSIVEYVAVMERISLKKQKAGALMKDVRFLPSASRLQLPVCPAALYFLVLLP